MPTRRAVVYTAAVYVSCPKCDAGLPEPKTGSFLWTLDDVRAAYPQECACGTNVEIRAPTRVEFK